MVYFNVAQLQRCRARGKHAILISLLLLGSPSSRVPAPAPPLAHLELDQLKPGDIVFRSGQGFRADLVRLAGNLPWSHVGLLAGDAKLGWTVIHSAPPEAGKSGGVVETTLSDFASLANSSRVAIFRDRRSSPRSRAAITRAARRLVDARIPFDERFDLTNSQALYCTELVAKVFATSGLELDVVPSRVAGFGSTILLPEDLISSQDLRRVA